MIEGPQLNVLKRAVERYSAARQALNMNWHTDTRVELENAGNWLCAVVMAFIEDGNEPSCERQSRLDRKELDGPDDAEIEAALEARAKEISSAPPLAMLALRDLEATRSKLIRRSAEEQVKSAEDFDIVERLKCVNSNRKPLKEIMEKWIGDMPSEEK